MDEKSKKAKLRRVLVVGNGSTFNQRRALFKMYDALGWCKQGIRDMTVKEASEAIDRAKNYINKNGFPRRSNAEE